MSLSKGKLRPHLATWGSVLVVIMEVVGNWGSSPISAAYWRVALAKPSLSLASLSCAEH